LPRSGKSQGKTKIFQGQGKVREFCKKSGKILVLVKVSEKSGNSNAMRSKSPEKRKEIENEDKNDIYTRLKKIKRGV